MRRRTVLQRMASALAALPFCDVRLQAQPRELTPEAIALLHELGATVLPASIGVEGMRVAVDRFVGWTREYREGVPLAHGYGHPSLRRSAPSPVPKYLDQLAALDRAARGKGGRFSALDLESGATRVLHHDHDDAWLGGPPPVEAYGLSPVLLEWLPGERLLFASEKTGFAHLYLREPGGEVRALTAGAWEVRAVELSRDRSRLLIGGGRALNAVWGVSEVRPWARRIPDYLAVLVVAPVVLGVAIPLRTTLESQTLVSWALQHPLFDALYHAGLRQLPTLLLVVGFSLYAFLPNTRVRPFSALLGGVAAALLFGLAQQASVALSIGAARSNAVFGALAGAALFLVWIHLSWSIFLLGAEVAYAHQTLPLYRREVRGEPASPAAREGPRHP